MYKSLQFFDKDGYNLNFSWNETYNYWEGKIYLPKVSVGLYANTSIYILEKIGDSFYFPQGNRKIEFYWDKVNKFVDEFFLFNFDESYVLKDTSSLKYIPNDGPDCETLIVNTFDRYEINLEYSFRIFTAFSQLNVTSTRLISTKLMICFIYNTFNMNH